MRTASYSLDSGGIDQLKKDFRRLTKIYRDVPYDNESLLDGTSQSRADEVKRIFDRFDKTVSKLVFTGLSTSNSILGDSVKEAGKEFLYSITDAFPYAREGVDTRRMRDDLDRNVRRMQKTFREFYKTLASYIEVRGGSVPIMPVEQVANVAGVKVIRDMRSRRELSPEFAGELDQALFSRLEQSFKLLHQAGFGKVLKGLKVIVDYKGKGMVAGEYDRGKDVLRLYPFGIEENERGSLGTLIHELGHRFYFREMDPSARSYYERVIGDAKIAITERHVQRYLDYIHYEDDRPVQRSTREMLRALEAYRAGMDSETIASLRWIIEEGQKPGSIFAPYTVQEELELKRYMMGHVETLVPFEYITEYGNTEPVEAYAESFRLYVEHGPRSLQRMTRELFERVSRTGRTASQHLPYGDVSMSENLTMSQRIAARVMKDMHQEMVSRIAARVFASNNEPTNPDLWKKVQELVRGDRKSLSVGDKTYDAPRDGKGFKKHPSAYSNGWAVKVYGELGGGWKTKS